MQTGTVVMMVLILGWVWGGFAYLLWRSMKAERARATDAGVAAEGDALDSGNRGSEG